MSFRLPQGRYEKTVYLNACFCFVILSVVEGQTKQRTNQYKIVESSTALRLTILQNRMKEVSRTILNYKTKTKHVIASAAKQS